MNTTENTTISGAPYFSDLGHTIIGCILAIVFVFGSTFNLFGLLTFIKCKQLRSPTNTFILSLLVGDLCMCFLGTPLAMTSSFSKRWIWGPSMCELEGFMVYFFGLANLYSLCAISLDRYVVIAMPLQSSKITHRVAAISVVLCWSGGFFWAVVPFFGWSYYHLEAAHTSCSVVWDSDDPVVVSYNMTIFFTCFIVPVGLMMYAYFNVYMTIRNIARNNTWDMTSRVARKRLAVEKKMFKTIILMVAVFLGAWTPYAAVSFWSAFLGSDGIPVTVQVIPAIAAKSSSIFNPIIYVATNKQFRLAFYSMIPCSSIRQNLEQKEEEKEERSDNDASNTRSKKQPESKRDNKVHPVEPDAIEETECDTQIDTVAQSPTSKKEHTKTNENLEMKSVSSEH